MNKIIKSMLVKLFGKKKLITPYQKFKMALAGDMSFLDKDWAKQLYAANLKAYPGSQIMCPFCGDLYQKICYDEVFHNIECEILYNDYVEKILPKENR